MPDMFRRTARPYSDLCGGERQGRDEHLAIPALLERLRGAETPMEVILALSGDVEGETTSFYIYRQIASLGRNDLKVTTLARGLGFGDDLEYADSLTLGRSILGRHEFRP